ncbi:hypothetical protein PUMCH_003464 [Australozyma saopauloensis]|uniref:ADIPOR-like receptor IZH3 n=1 Tax=Australozyma saopauloensis TaxID=291208 RepID=A0AAX4HCV7_9ASCO|nr:hypothetical protein PUMCH_003464 [[Candida] saopauloensis]
MSSQTELRNRLHVTPPPSSGSAKAPEELLVEKLDAFLLSIEQRLHSFETYFQLTGAEDSELDAGSKQPQSRRSSTVLVLQMKEFSRSNLNKVYEQLSTVKDQMLKTSIMNLEYLYKTLDDKYTDLFDLEDDEVADIVPSGGSNGSNTDVLTKKIITNLHFFEEKLLQIDAYIKSKTPLATDAYEEDAKFNRFRFFNFNKALKTGQSKYLHYYQLPLSWRENRYIINGYRFSLSHNSMLQSIFHFNHNETWNIWTHILGGLAMVYLGLFHYPQTSAYANSSFGDNVIMIVFLLASLKCLVSSVLWHTYSTFAHLTIRNRFACVDYTGITVLVTCSVISAEYCSLYNYPKLLASFMTFSIVAGLGGFAFNWSSYFDRPECRPLRIGFYVCLAALGASTFLCKWYYDGFFSAVTFYAPLTYRSFVWYWIGVIFYGGLIPERWRYDVIIHEDETCHHAHSALEVLMGNIENCGEEELQTLTNEIKSKQRDVDQSRRNSAATIATMESETSYHSIEPLDNASETSSEESDEVKYKEILEKHFPERPRLTPYHNDFLSLWWVDYAFQSHNLWHIFVVFGVIGHYFCIVEMFERNHMEILGNL